MKLKTLTLTMRSDDTIKANAAKLRGFFATEFNNYILLHQHKGDGFVYRYPLVQYKMIEDIPWLWELEVSIALSNEPIINDGFKMVLNSKAKSRPDY